MISGAKACVKVLRAIVRPTRKHSVHCRVGQENQPPIPHKGVQSSARQHQLCEFMMLGSSGLCGLRRLTEQMDVKLECEVCSQLGLRACGGWKQKRTHRFQSSANL